MLEFLTFRRLLLVLTVQLTTLLQGMSITVISVVLPQMKGTLSATQDQIAWTVTWFVTPWLRRDSQKTWVRFAHPCRTQVIGYDNTHKRGAA